MIKECADEEDADGFIPYERKLISIIYMISHMFYFIAFTNIKLDIILLFRFYKHKIALFIPAFLKRVCGGPHPEMYEDW